MEAADALARLRAAAAEPLAAARAHAAAGGRVIAHLCDNVPTELIVAAGAFPLRVRPGAHASIETARRLVDTLYPPEVTERPPFVGAMLGAILDGDYAFVDAIIVPHNRGAVQAMHRELADAAREHGLTLPETWYLDKAWSPHAGAAEYDRAQVEKLHARLEAHVGRRITDDDLSRAIGQVDRARAAIGLVAAARSAGRLSGSTAIELIAAYWCLPPADFAELAEAALQTLPSGQRGRRIVLAGSPVDDPELYRVIERTGAVIVDEDHCWGSRAGDLRVDTALPPLGAIAARFHAFPACSIRFPLARTVAATVDRATSANVDGAILYALRGDTAQAWEAPDEVAALEAAGIPVLVLSDEPYDPATSPRLAERIADFVAR